MIELENRSFSAKIQGNCATINGSTVFLLNCVKNDRIGLGGKTVFRVRIFLICFREIGLGEGGSVYAPFYGRCYDLLLITVNVYELQSCPADGALARSCCLLLIASFDKRQSNKGIF